MHKIAAKESKLEMSDKIFTHINIGIQSLLDFQYSINCIVLGNNKFLGM